MAVTITDQNFAEETARGLVLLDFWGDWCQPCKMLDPVLAQLESQFGNQIKFAKVDVGQFRELAEQFGIQNIPTQILFVDGQAKEKITGYRPLKPFEDYLRQKIDQYLN